MLRAVPDRPYDKPKGGKPRRERGDVGPDLREALRVRSGGFCESCGDRDKPLRPGWHAHHRLRRSQGGEDSITNLLALHPYCHDKIHARPAAAYDGGFLVRMGQQPGRVRLALHWEKWVRLARDGSYVLLGGDT